MLTDNPLAGTERNDYMKTTPTPTAQTAGHTATPWDYMLSGDAFIIKSDKGNIAKLCRVDSFMEGTQIGNAAFIVEACNNYQQLRQALETCQKVLEVYVHTDEKPEMVAFAEALVDAEQALAATPPR